MLKLILPVLFPSWRFFNSVGPSPRVEYGFSCDATTPPGLWQEFRPRPIAISWQQGLRRLFYNPTWNEYLFITCCAERLSQDAGAQQRQEIFARLHWAIQRGEITVPQGLLWLSFRVMVVERGEGGSLKSLAYLAPPQHLSDLATP